MRVLALNTEGFSCAHLRELINRLIIEDAAPDMDMGIINDMRETFGMEAKETESNKNLIG